MDYLGNKTGLTDVIVHEISNLIGPRGRVTDAFAGTGAVSLALARAGHTVEANDHLPLAVVWSRARLLGGGVRFDGLRPELGDLGPDPLVTVVDALGRLEGAEGWITRNYSPLSLRHTGIERRYLTEDNARRIDAVRHRLRRWRPMLTAAEHAVLLTSLVDAVVAVSNIAGTYGCYLKAWKPTALRPLVLLPYRDFAPPRGGHKISCRDAEMVAAESTADAIYADPPYTKRQYAAYYHLLNSIVTDNEGELTGSTGLPDWRPLASDWCYKVRAPLALERLVSKSGAQIFVFSYSSDGHIADDTIRDVLQTYGRLHVREHSRRRYRSSALPHRSASVVERIYVLQR